MILTIKQPVGLFSAKELEEFERNLSKGVSSQDVISLFQSRGVKLSEATFRKYVQLGLLPTSRRVGRKGKHKGSQGVYPVSVIRRINLIKSMMAQDMTLEEIHDSFVAVQNSLEEAEAALNELFGRMSGRIEQLKERGHLTKPLTSELSKIVKSAARLIEKTEKVSSQLAVVGTTPVPKD